MPSIGPNYPTAGTNEGATGGTWINPNGITAEGGVIARVDPSGADTKFLVATGFDFSSVPDGATIIGIEISIRGSFISTPP